MKKFIKRNKSILMTMMLGLVVAISGITIYNVELERKTVLESYRAQIQELEIRMKAVEDSNLALTYMNEDYQKENSMNRQTISNLESYTEELNNKLFELETIVNDSLVYDANNYSRGALADKPLDKYGAISEEELNGWIAERAPADSIFLGQAETFLDAAKETGLDPKYIIAHAGLESGWGASQIARTKHNYFGITAYNHDPFNSASEFDSFRHGIIEGAKWIKRNYTDVGQDTLNSMLYGIKAYAQHDDGSPNQGWIDKIVNIIL